MFRTTVIAACLTLLAARSAIAQETPNRPLLEVTLGGGITLNYIEAGTGTPVIFIHGSTDDLYMWTRYVDSFGKDYHAIAYSRRYNYPNKNEIPESADHSTAIEAKDLAEFITKLKLPKAHVVGYSYGGYTALHLAVEHPEMVRTLTLAEPPLFPWLANVSDNQEEGKRMLELNRTRFEEPAREALNSDAENRVEEAMRIFNDYAIADGFWASLSEEERQGLMRNSPELVALLESTNMFAPMSKNEVASLTMPVLMMSGRNSIGPLQLIDAELERVLPKCIAKRVFIVDATHGMWYEKPTACTKVLSDFLKCH